MNILPPTRSNLFRVAVRVTLAQYAGGMSEPLRVLQEYFGHDNFRSQQSAIIDSILSGQDTLAILPTGGGKSVCYQIPGLLLAGTTVVVSPLISLMKDQVDALTVKGICATYISSSLTADEIEKRLQLLVTGSLKFIYVAPERLVTEKFIALCQMITIPLVAVDEAHCISQWGHDFRPEYQQISSFITSLPKQPTIAAFTATATPTVRDDISNSLQLIKPAVFVDSFQRPNLSFHAFICNDQSARELLLFRLLKKHTGQSGIIYVATQKKAEELVALITIFEKQLRIRAYHAGLAGDQREIIQDQFLHDELDIIVATNAFGMGVDKPNVRFVIHYQIPGNIESYYQEAGRAGRDQQPADCYLLFHQPDVAIQQTFSAPLIETNKTLFDYRRKQLQQMVAYADTQLCKQQYIAHYFAEESARCEHCSSCLHTTIAPSVLEKKRREQLLIIQKSLSKKSRVHPTQIFTQKVLRFLALHQPQTAQEYLAIPGIGYGWLEKWYNSVSELLEEGTAHGNDVTTVGE